MTMSGVSIDGDKLRWCTAGALPIMVVSEGAVTVLAALGTPLGSLEEDFAIGVCEHVLTPGARVAIFTDGLPELESRPGRLIGLLWLQKFLLRTQASSIDDTMAALVSELQAIVKGAPLADDITVVLIDYAPAPVGTAKATSRDPRA